MVHNHVVHRRLHNRQDGINTPTAAGLESAIVAQTGAAAGGTLAINSAATGIVNNGNVGFSASPTATFTDPAPTQSSDSSPDSASSAVSSSSPTAVSASSSDISMSTVIGACLGALAGCIFIIFIGLWLYRRGNKPRPRSPSNARKGPMDKERAWGKLEDDNEDKWEGKDGGNKHTQKGVVSVGPMEKLTMFQKGTPSIRTTYTVGNTPDPEHGHLPPIAPFDHPFAQYHPDLAEKLAKEDNTTELTQPRPFLARVEAMPPISWDGDTVGRDSFLSLSSNMGPGLDLALPTPKLTSSEPHHWESAEVMNFEHNEQAASFVEDDAPRGRTSVAEPSAEPRKKSSNNPFFGSRMSTHSTHSRSHSRSYSQSRASSRAASPVQPDPVTMPTAPASAYTREEKGKYRAITPPSPRSSIGASTITGVNPFSDPPIAPIVPLSPSHHESTGSNDRALQSLIAALGSTAEDVEERLRVASMQPSVVSEVSAYTETDADALRESWPVPPSRPQPDYD